MSIASHGNLQNQIPNDAIQPAIRAIPFSCGKVGNTTRFCSSLLGADPEACAGRQSGSGEGLQKFMYVEDFFVFVMSF